MSVVHIGEWRNHELLASCGAVPGTLAYISRGDSCVTKGDEAWRTESILRFATCVDCLQEWLRDKCSLCDGSGLIQSGCSDKSCCGPSRCRGCDKEATEAVIAKQAAAERSEVGR